MRRTVVAGISSMCLLAAAASGAADGAAAQVKLHDVHLSAPVGYLAPGQDQTVAFSGQHGLPRGSYYYAVAVLTGYRARRGAATPGCALSSDMGHVQYARPRPHGLTRITLAPASASSGGWCQGGSYQGAVYAVPHRPPCSSEYPCYGRRTCGGAGPVCGVVPLETTEYSYPGGLPRPIDRQSRIVARFTLRFGAVPESTLSFPQRATRLTSEQAASLLTLARRMAAADEEPHPFDIEAARLTRDQISQAEGGAGSAPAGGEEELLYVALRGHFVCDTCSGPRGAKAPSGPVLTLGFSPGSSSLVQLGILDAYPRTGIAGLPVRLG